ncbi:hypothetical protein SPRG_12508 [Saprolegnia parasitica CBS 223.65]|uniref:C2 domain-containing protein n=1 Tax=Saprolegnia parasitica (strain CBS 223.65) TaxID=695850 RepID=A0A067BX84_SAPPC|nr:hypothetical protein SPRG_12508 [Saprolegnia parasitica CBS 223.65]KDO21465.1 hypothetical protein SPRG_12508 [Saprolegnia parasitica CBS 223.65]|eukprot:XP_012207809.1 hypothetical protein SPRG_12508 [Saprolegnia parasitica CBS 223.65]
MATIALDIGQAPTTYGSHGDVVGSEYYYALVFPNTPHALDAGATDRISFADATDVIRRVTCGSDADKDAAVEEFRDAWVVKFRSLAPAATDRIPRHFFRELMRNIVLQRLEAVPGITLATQISADDQSIYCLVRLTRDALVHLAGDVQLNLPIWSEIDPGSQYWLEHGHETTEYATEVAEKELHRLFLEGHVTADEAQVFPGESPAMVARRISALKRIANPSVQKRFPSTALLYFPFQADPALHYLFRHVEGTLPFRWVDKMRLTKAALDKAFNCEMLQQEGFLTHHLCLHMPTSCEHSDDVSLDQLCAQWGALSSYVYLYKHSICRSWRVLFYQPIELIRDYFGEELGLYFAFLSFYAEMLVVLIGISIVDAPFSLVLPDAVLGYYNMVLASVNCLYACFMLRKWDVRQRALAVAWGMDNVQADATIRAEYTGVVGISPVTNAPELIARPQLQAMRKLQATCLLCLAMGLNGLAIYAVFALQAHYESIYDSDDSFTVYSNIVIALLINLSQVPFQPIVVRLNQFENHRTHHAFHVALTVKFALFQTINNFGPILFSTYLKPYIFGCNLSTMPHLDAAACADETEHLLLSVLFFNLALSVREIATPLLLTVRHAYNARRTRIYTPLDTEMGSRSLNDELTLDVYDGVLFDYAQISITFGYITWFGALAPQAAVIALAITLVQIRVDAYKLCYLMQRPMPLPASSIGGWMIYFRMLTLSGVVINAGNVVIVQMLASQANMTFRSIPMSAWLDQLFSLTLLMTALYLASVLVSLHDASDREVLHTIKSTLKRQAYLQETYLFQLTSKDKVDQVLRPPGDIFLNGVFRYIVSGDINDGEQVEELREELCALEAKIQAFPKLETELLGMLYVVIVGANILPIMDRSTKALDAFLKVKLKQGDKLLPSKAKTVVKKKQRSPVWNAPFEFKITSMETRLVMEVYDWNLVGKSKLVGVASVPITRALTSAVDFNEMAVEGICDMVALNVPVEIESKLLATMASDIPKFGKPVLHISLGVRLNELGCQGLRLHNYVARTREIVKAMDTYLVWKPRRPRQSTIDDDNSR